MQRLRIKFSRGPQIKFISHLDITRLWQRAFNRAGIEIAYSTGFTPHPRLSLAAPLPLGVTSEAELMDVFIVKGVAPHFFVSAVNQQLPPGMSVDKVYPIAFDLPSLQSQISRADYKVELETDKGPADIAETVNVLMAKEHLPWQHQRDTGPHQYDLRALIVSVCVTQWQPPVGILEMRLRCDSNGSGRPEQVAAALGFSQRPVSIHRTQLVLRDGKVTGA
ncbi:MAG TPA: TIGR03936 family radical SAM-associated protein [Dehalococcoidales bacterium]